MKSFKRLRMALAVGAALGMANAAQASLVLVSPTDVSGTGVGAVNTVLTLQSPGNSSTETGSVGLSATGTQVTSGDVMTGASQTQVRSLSTVGISSASQLRVVLNAAEPGNAADNGINLNNLVLNIFSPTGSLLFTSGVFAPQSFSSTLNGVGTAGFVFGLDAAQQAAATAAGAFSSTSNVIGLSASLSAATGGPETFFVASSTGGGTVPPVASVPEPETYGMLLSGLGLLGFVARRRRRK